MCPVVQRRCSLWAIYVDDIILGGKNQTRVNMVKEKFSDERLRIITPFSRCQDQNNLDRPAIVY